VLVALTVGIQPYGHHTGHVLSTLPAASQQVLTGRLFFPALISGPCHQGLVIVFCVAAGLAAVAAVASCCAAGAS
jgi:hypothetical protein